MTPNDLIKAADAALKAATEAANKAAELDAAVFAYWPDMCAVAPNPRWFAKSLRQQADVAAGLAHSMQLWAHEALTRDGGKS